MPSKEHLTCSSTRKEKLKRCEMGKEITSLVKTKVIKKIDKVAFLATHQLALRGKIGSFESEDERENALFLSQLDYTVEKDHRVRAIIKTIPCNTHQSRYVKRTYCCYELSGNRGY